MELYGMKSTAILDLMIRDHQQILANLADVEQSINEDFNLMKNSFHRFQWNLEKHFFVEERAIFLSYFPNESSEDYHYFSELMDQHEKIFETINTIRNKLKILERNELMNFKKMLIKHKNFEEKQIYPVIDAEIDESEKQYIINRIRDVRL